MNAKLNNEVRGFGNCFFSEKDIGSESQEHINLTVVQEALNRNG